MAHNARDPDDRPTEEAALSARLRRLGEQLDSQRGGRSSDAAPAAQTTTNPSGFARGFQLSSELVGGVVAGALIGWALDHWLGISPWGLIVFVMVGFVAGVVNVMRSAGVWPGHEASDHGTERQAQRRPQEKGNP
jgi:ATP synthase protein I